MSMKKSSGVVIAVTAAALFGAVSVANAQGAQVKCTGINACKGQSACKTASSACKGQNACKGKGYVMASAADCKSKGGTEVK
jgi:hypothetical protein